MPSWSHTSSLTMKFTALAVGAFWRFARDNPIANKSVCVSLLKDVGQSLCYWSPNVLSTSGPTSTLPICGEAAPSPDTITKERCHQANTRGKDIEDLSILTDSPKLHLAFYNMLFCTERKHNCTEEANTLVMPTTGAHMMPRLFHFTVH